MSKVNISSQKDLSVAKVLCLFRHTYKKVGNLENRKHFRRHTHLWMRKDIVDTLRVTLENVRTFLAVNKNFSLDV